MGFTQDSKFVVEYWYDYVIFYFTSLFFIFTVQYVVSYTFYILPVALYVAIPYTDKKLKEHYKENEKQTGKKLL